MVGCVFLSRTDAAFYLYSTLTHSHGMQDPLFVPQVRCTTLVSPDPP